MSSLHRDESGLTLVELLVTCVLMTIVLGATLLALDSFQRNARVNDRQNDAQDLARQATDLLARDLRNLASPVELLPLAVDRAQPQDVIFQSEGRLKPVGSANEQNTRRMRYCLSADGVLYRQVQTWVAATPPGVPSSTTCPSAAWATELAVAEHVVNDERQLFTYNATALDQITEISTSLWVDVNPGASPSEVALQSSVFLRNQNRMPTAEFSVALQGTQVLLNGSESKDPEEKPLTYTWFDSASPGVPIGTGIVLTYAATPGTHSYFLKVSDGPLGDEAPPQSICVPGTGVTCSIG
jgi:type II secretory pathway pseudopilin PulG